MNRCRCSCSARLLANTTESSSESVELCRTPQGRTQLWESEHDEREESWGRELELRCGTLGSSSPSSFYSRQSMNPTRILTVLGFGGTANLQSPPLRILLRLRGGECQIFFSSMEAQQRHRWLSRLLSLYSKATSLASSVQHRQEQV